MKRWAIVAVMTLLAVLAGAAGWRAYQLNADLDGSREEIVSLKEDVSSFRSSSAAKDDELEARAAQLKALDRELRKKSRLIRERQPCPYFPRLILSPDNGPPGTRVDFTGYCFVDDYASRHMDRFDIDPLTSGYGLFIMNSAQDVSDHNSNGGPECELIGGTEPHELVIRSNGTARGYFTIPSSGGCFQENRDEVVSPGRYSIGLRCHTCAPLAVFRVTPL